MFTCICLFEKGQKTARAKHLLVSIHERSLAYMILIPAALVCPKKCGAVAEDASIIASQYSISHIDLIDEKGGRSFFCTVRKQTCQKTPLCSSVKR